MKLQSTYWSKSQENCSHTKGIIISVFLKFSPSSESVTILCHGLSLSGLLHCQVFSLSGVFNVRCPFCQVPSMSGVLSVGCPHCQVSSLPESLCQVSSLSGVLSISCSPAKWLTHKRCCSMWLYLPWFLLFENCPECWTSPHPTTFDPSRTLSQPWHLVILRKEKIWSSYHK